MLREPAVCGQFYPAVKSTLIKQIEGFLPAKISAIGGPASGGKKLDTIGAILPHAGYIYSGRVAVETASLIEPKETYIVIGPNHSGLGKDFSIQTQGKWLTPLGEVEIDSKLATELQKNSKFLKKDMLAHKFEHSVEVEIPILQYFNKNFKFVPIVIASQEFNDLKLLGEEIASTIKKLNLEKKVALIASSDMTHYEEHKQASKKDKEAIEAILKLDIDLFIKRITDLNVSMCGWAPATILLSYALKLGAKKSELVKYQTSGDTSGDYSSVVGYAGIIIA